MHQVKNVPVYIPFRVLFHAYEMPEELNENYLFTFYLVPMFVSWFA